MSATVTAGTLSGFETLTLENDQARIVVIPALGGRVWELTDRIRKRQWIWHREGRSLAASPVGSTYDDVWAGGWEELFPNDAAGLFEGRELPDHGEWWATPFSVAEVTTGPEAVVRLVATTTIRRAVCVKEFRLGADSDTVRVTYRIESREAEAFHFLFKQHLPVALTSACRLVLPGGRVTPVDPGFSMLTSGAGPFEWPWAKGGDGTVDLRVIPHRSRATREFVYVDQLPESWCGIDDLERGASLRLRYDGTQMPFVWLFLAYGGWQDCYTAVLEPCTNMPKDLAEASRRGQSAQLAAGGVFETEVSVTMGSLTP